MPSTSLIAIIARCTTIQFADCAQPARMNNPRNPDSNPRKKRDEPHQDRTNLASLVAGLEGRPLQRRLQGLHRLRPATRPRRNEQANQKQGRGGEGQRGVLLEEGLDLSGLLLDAGDDGLQILVRVRVRRRRRHLAGAGDTEGGVGCRGCYEKRRGVPRL